jgi:UDP-glucose 4-epimerase
VLSQIFCLAIKGLPLPIFSDGTETRDWTYFGDIVNGLFARGIHEKEIGEAFNLRAGKE